MPEQTLSSSKMVILVTKKKNYASWSLYVVKQVCVSSISGSSVVLTSIIVRLAQNKLFGLQRVKIC